MRRWFKVGDVEQTKIDKEIEGGNKLASYGIVRASLGIQNTEKDIDKLLKALIKIEKYGPSKKYKPVPNEETYSVIK